MNAPILTSGAWTIRALDNGTHCFAREYIDSLQKAEQQKATALLQRASQEGPPKNTQKFVKVEGDIYEFKPSKQDRLLCFFEGEKTIIITHGFTKKSRRIPRNEIDRANSLIARFREDAGVSL